MKKMLIVIDPFDPGLSMEHQLYLLHRHLASDTEIYVKLLAHHPLFLQHLNKDINILAPINHRISSAKKDPCNPKNWLFTLRPRPVPWHIRKAYYNFPSLVRLYWKYINREVTESHIHYDEAISLSTGIVTFYLRDKVQAKKKVYYFPVRQFKQAVAPIIDQLCQGDFVYTASKSMYRELKINNSRMTYYPDPYYNESLDRVLQLSEIIRYHQPHVSLLSTNLQNRENIEGFIHMCRYLVKQNTPFRWYFYGKNQNEAIIRKELKSQQLEDYVVFIGDVANVFRYLANADIYVECKQQSSLYFEAEMMHKPIVHIKNELPSGSSHIVQALKSIKKM
ncbi:Glycosyltransferase involved in cell wall bisynthesis [Gracilibacillus orientalis]|uniref:Glycosyltransferase involved in cell wall bisynthesis n=1 Tax=Gracilibacillus orientalis TaxID=334253 RepID=A0A1I4IJR9_9BACI|nr:glycosyltransferase [Gracilibacillus orientalis]SFL54568.1 Glycosyltransferase involved in cell wall bisynthesis [Gracilibacillus orientalis]